jgi:hypothetical protein
LYCRVIYLIKTYNFHTKFSSFEFIRNSYDVCENAEEVNAVSNNGITLPPYEMAVGNTTAVPNYHFIWRYRVT